jgi:hypothetical protein
MRAAEIEKIKIFSSIEIRSMKNLVLMELNTVRKIKT